MMNPIVRLAWLVPCISLVCAPAYAADEHGHDHGPAVATANPNAPRRLPDGSVFLPKPAQRQMVVRTVVAEKGSLARSFVLNGRVTMDPNASGKVQTLIAGRIVAGPSGLPAVGQPVRQGQLLAYVSPSIGQVERSNQNAALAELRAAKSLAEKRLARAKELSDTVPRKEIEAIESELASLTDRMAALSGGLSARDALVAPVTGVIASSNAVLGQVVDARQIVFEIVDPRRLRVEALAYDLDVARDIDSASLAAGGESVPLKFVGAAQALREQALPLAFRGEGKALSNLALGQPVKVIVQTRAKVEGIAVPAGSVMRDPSNQDIVWVKTGPEVFAPRRVTSQPLDGLRVAVTSGLNPGDRLVTSGARLVNQIR